MIFCISGFLRGKVRKWFSGCNKKLCSSNSFSPKMQVLKSLYEYPERFIKHQYCLDSIVTYDDEDLDAWRLEVQRWTRVLFLVITEEHHLEPIFMVCLLSLFDCYHIGFFIVLSQHSDT